MNRLTAMLTAAAIIAASTNTLAADKAGAPVNLIPNTTTPAPAAGAANVQAAQPSVEAETLRDGTKIEISDDDTVTIINPDGTRNAAPDGILTLKDQTTMDVKDGKRVNY